MWTKRELLLFLAGFELFHTISHIVIAKLGDTPVKVYFPEETWRKWNFWTIIVNGVITLGLLIWASKI